MATPAAMLPLGLSALVAVDSSEDVDALLAARALPGLARILQSFSPLPKITTRTAALTPIEHAEFALRFEALPALVAAAREPPDARAGRFVDWVSARIARKAAGWVDEYEAAIEEAGGAEGDAPPPWWDELAACVEGERAPDRGEGWNHPTSVVLAVSTHAPNALQALAQLHTRPPELPTWVDTAHLRATLILHARGSPLSDEEATALLNAAKKQYGPHTYLLPLDLPDAPPPPAVPVPPQHPRLPPPDAPDAQEQEEAGIVDGQMRMDERDIAATARFVRELVTTSLVPWMEKCVLDWNDAFSSTRRLPSRLFSSTRRLFGSGPASPAPISPVSPATRAGHASSFSISSSSSSTWAPPQLPTTFPQQRRLAEFATVLGDLKTAVPVWDQVRKDARGGSDVLPLLLAPGPASVLHAQHALSTLFDPAAEPTASAQVRALAYAVRWALGLPPRDFLSPALDGARWLAAAAAPRAEEPPAALLLAHAAWCAARAGARRRAALWYLAAARRLETSGIRPLTLHFLRRAHALHAQSVSAEKALNPAFWDAHGAGGGADAVRPGLEHALGRLYYSAGDVPRAVELFLSLLGASAAGGEAADAMDREALADFRTAFQHLQENGKDAPAGLALPVSFVDARRTRVRLSGDAGGGTPELWAARADAWRAHRKSVGDKGGALPAAGGPGAGEVFWVDLALRNPLGVEVALRGLTLELSASADGPPLGAEDVEVQAVDELVLGAREALRVPLAVRARSSGPLHVLAARFAFAGLLDVREGLEVRGPRLQDTAVQRQGRVYGPATRPRADVAKADVRLAAAFVEDARLALARGECKRMALFVRNAGSRRIAEAWVVRGAEDVFVVEGAEDGGEGEWKEEEVVRDANSLAAEEVVKLEGIDLEPGASTEVALTLHADTLGPQELCLLLVFRADGDDAFYSTRVTRAYEVEPLLELELAHRPALGAPHAFVLELALRNVSQATPVALLQTSTVSPSWTSSALAGAPAGAAAELHPGQEVWMARAVPPVAHAPDTRAASAAFVEEKLGAVLLGTELSHAPPPPLELLASHTPHTDSPISFAAPPAAALLRLAHRASAARAAAAAHAHIPPALHAHVFPARHPLALDALVHWAVPAESRTGFVRASALLGAQAGALDGLLARAGGAKVVRSMYAETGRARVALAEEVRASEWNALACPVRARAVPDAAGEGEEAGAKNVRFELRNLDADRPARFVLRLAPPRAPGAPRWAGRLVHKGALAPLGGAAVRARVGAPGAGAYALGEWALEVECAGRRFLCGPEPDGEGAGAGTLVVEAGAGV